MYIITNRNLNHLCTLKAVELYYPFVSAASNIVLMSAKAVLVDFGLTVQMKDDVYVPRDLRGTEVSVCAL